ncbi:MAG TPA: hypothetical protein VF753_10500, partial [Terriglobales bacterium]
PGTARTISAEPTPKSWAAKRAPRLTAIKQGVLRTGVGSRTEVSVAFERVLHYFDLIVEPLRDAGGMLLGLICSATDITSSKPRRGNLWVILLDSARGSAEETVKLPAGGIEGPL